MHSIIKYKKRWFFFLFATIWLACNRNRELTPTPAGELAFSNTVYQSLPNVITQDEFELGKKLFYDKNLSLNNTIACASCHVQKASFGTLNHDRSHGIHESHTLRNAPVLVNLIWKKYLHWDGAYQSLLSEPLQPITGHIEMGETMQGVVEKLEENEQYLSMFKKVFGNKKISVQNILQSLNYFMVSLISNQSKYDLYKKGKAIFTVSEEAGYKLFLQHCATCHTEPLFTDNSFRNIGLPVDAFLQDYGRKLFTGKKEDSIKFLVPTLRNIETSANYMHDGRFITLAQCINHYRYGIQKSSTLDAALQNNITLTDDEAIKIIQFLKTLTDTAFINNNRFKEGP